MSELATTWATQQNITQQVEKNVLVFLASNIDGTFVSEYSIDHISIATKQDEGDVFSAVSTLLELSFIRIQLINDGICGHPYTHYILNIDQDYYKERK